MTSRRSKSPVTTGNTAGYNTLLLLKMGGCKCSYRNCTVKTDGVTHMFHYPVFDKIRCHQWLKNSHRLDFLNLKVSQLKNRVICQNHFQLECFMNFKDLKLRTSAWWTYAIENIIFVVKLSFTLHRPMKRKQNPGIRPKKLDQFFAAKDKLKHDAIPTENGPFCDAEDWDEKGAEVLQALNLDREEIENEPLSYKEKKAHLASKFGDFLLNGDTDIDKISSVVIKDVSANYGTNTETTYSLSQPTKMRPIDLYESKKQPVLRVQPFSDCKTFKAKPVSVTHLANTSKASNINTVNKNKVRILSEKKITTPLSLQGRLEPVSPSLPIRLRDKCNDSINQGAGFCVKNENFGTIPNTELIFCGPQSGVRNEMNEQVQFNPQVIEPQVNEECGFVVNSIDKIFDVNMSHPVILQGSNENVPQGVQLLNCSQSMPVLNTEQQTNLQEIQELLESKTSSQNTELPSIVTPVASVSKIRVPPERLAAIEEKRKFNKKLRDMIEFCLDGLDAPEKQKENKPKIASEQRLAENVQELSSVEAESVEKKNTKLCKSNARQKPEKVQNKECQNAENSLKVVSHLSKELNLPNNNEYAMASIEARLIKMEETLLRKIEQNSQRIVDLKEVVETSKKPCRDITKSVCSQTIEEEESCKKRLYEDISQYLSPETRSIVFEEMFLNKYFKDSLKDKNFMQIEIEETPEEVSTPPKRRRRRRCK